jgi:hypothetical protein
MGGPRRHMSTEDTSIYKVWEVWEDVVSIYRPHAEVRGQIGSVENTRSQLPAERCVVTLCGALQRLVCLVRSHCTRKPVHLSSTLLEVTPAYPTSTHHHKSE